MSPGLQPGLFIFFAALLFIHWQGRSQRRQVGVFVFQRFARQAERHEIDEGAFTRAGVAQEHEAVITVQLLQGRGAPGLAALHQVFHFGIFAYLLPLIVFG